MTMCQASIARRVSQSGVLLWQLWHFELPQNIRVMANIVTLETITHNALS